jgi:hypothetical protein
MMTSGPPSLVNSLVTITTTLTSNGGMPTGQVVTFSYNGATLGTGMISGGKVDILLR